MINIVCRFCLTDSTVPCLGMCGKQDKVGDKSNNAWVEFPSVRALS